MNTQQHLSESDFADAVLGLAGTAANAHLLHCDLCRDELVAFGGSIIAFRQASLQASRELAAEHPIDSAAIAAGRRRWSYTPAAQWGFGLAAAAALTLAVVLPNQIQRHHAASVAALQAAAPTTAEISSDNQMMAAIDAELSQPDATPLESIQVFGPHNLTTQPAAHMQAGNSPRKKS